MKFGIEQLEQIINGGLYYVRDIGSFIKSSNKLYAYISENHLYINLISGETITLILKYHFKDFDIDIFISNGRYEYLNISDCTLQREEESSLDYNKIKEQLKNYYDLPF
jgi:predicted RNA-binding protein (virulence factor B family)